MKPPLDWLRGSGAIVDHWLDRHPKVTAILARYGWLSLVAVAAAFAVGASVINPGGGQQIVYVTREGSVVALDPGSGAISTIYAGGAGDYATGLTPTGGSRSLPFTVLKDNGGPFRGDVYSVDMLRDTRSRLTQPAPKEAFAFPAFSFNRQQISATRYSSNSPPNIFVIESSGASNILIEPNLPGRPAILGPVWISDNALYAWRISGSGKSTLTAYNFFERRKTAVYETDQEVSLPSYYRDANTLVFAERPKGSSLKDYRLKVLAGTTSLPVAGADGLGLYDLSPPSAALDGEMAVIWTNGSESGIGLFNPATRGFRKTPVPVSYGSRYPQVSPDGRYVVSMDADSKQLTVQRMDDGSIVRRVEDVQPRDASLQRMRAAGLEVPPEAEWFLPAPYSWRTLQ